MHQLTCGISSLLHSVNLIHCPPGSPHPAHNHLITATTFALITYHCLYLPLQT